MVTLHNRIRAGGFVESEGNSFYSRDQITIAGGAGVLFPGTVLGKITSSGKYTISPKTGSDGSQIAVAILWDYADATDGDVIAAAVSRAAEVRADDLTFDPSVALLSDQEAKHTQLRAAGIIVRF